MVSLKWNEISILALCMPICQCPVCHYSDSVSSLLVNRNQPLRQILPSRILLLKNYAKMFLSWKLEATRLKHIFIFSWFPLHQSFLVWEKHTLAVSVRFSLVIMKFLFISKASIKTIFKTTKLSCLKLSFISCQTPVFFLIFFIARFYSWQIMLQISFICNFSYFQSASMR